MEGKKRVVPREICMIRSEKSNCYRKVALNMQKSAEAILAESFFSVKGQINRSLEYDRERRNEQMGTENKESCSQRDSAERKGYVRAHRSFNRIWKERDSAEPDILGKIPSLTVNRRKNRRIPCIYWAAAIFSLLRTIVIYSFPLLFFWIVLILLLVMNW